MKRKERKNHFAASLPETYTGSGDGWVLLSFFFFFFLNQDYTRYKGADCIHISSRSLQASVLATSTFYLWWQKQNSEYHMCPHTGSHLELDILLKATSTWATQGLQTKNLQITGRPPLPPEPQLPQNQS